MFTELDDDHLCGDTHALITHEQGSRDGMRDPDLSHHQLRDGTRDLIAALDHALRGVEAARIYRDGAADPAVRAYQSRSEELYGELAREGRRLLRQALNREDAPFGRFAGSGADHGYAVADRL